MLPLLTTHPFLFQQRYFFIISAALFYTIFFLLVRMPVFVSCANVTCVTVPSVNMQDLFQGLAFFFSFGVMLYPVPASSAFSHLLDA
jgi:hypothetical protein